MSDVEALLVELVAANERVSQAQADRETAMRERDQLIRAARAVAISWDTLEERTGLSRATIAKALRRD